MLDTSATKTAACSSSRAAEDTPPRVGERQAGVVDYEGVITRVVCADSGVYELDDATCLLTRYTQLTCFTGAKYKY